MYMHHLGPLPAHFGIVLLGILVVKMLFIGLVVVAIISLVRHYSAGKTAVVAGPEPPRAILDRRLAAGEITGEDYETIRHKLGI